MKEHILRAPETDRKKVRVPNLLTDLDDYADTLCSGAGQSDPYDSVGNSGTYSGVGMDTFTDLVNVTGAAEGLVAGKAGLFMITAQLLWIVGGTIPGPLPRAQIALRNSQVRINGTTVVGLLTVAGTDAGMDSGSFLTRLEASDEVSIYAASTDAASDGRLVGILSIVKVAP